MREAASGMTPVKKSLTATSHVRYYSFRACVGGGCDMAPGDVRAEVNDPPSWIAGGRLRFRNPTKLYPAKPAFPPRHRKSVRQRTRPRKRRRNSDTRHDLRFKTGRLCARTQLTHPKLLYTRATTTATHQTPIRPPHKRTSALALASSHPHNVLLPHNTHALGHRHAPQSPGRPQSPRSPQTHDNRLPPRLTIRRRPDHADKRAHRRQGG
jgi:hypothetical protein